MITCRFIDPQTGQSCGRLTSGTSMCTAHIDFVQAYYKTSGTKTGRSSSKPPNMSSAVPVQTIELTSKRWKGRLLIVNTIAIVCLFVVPTGLIFGNYVRVGIAGLMLLLCVIYRLYIGFMIWWNHK